jgi:hypothetical protein
MRKNSDCMLCAGVNIRQRTSDVFLIFHSGAKCTVRKGQSRGTPGERTA